EQARHLTHVPPQLADAFPPQPSAQHRQCLAQPSRGDAGLVDGMLVPFQRERELLVQRALPCGECSTKNVPGTHVRMNRPRAETHDRNTRVTSEERRM